MKLGDNIPHHVPTPLATFVNMQHRRRRRKKSSKVYTSMRATKTRARAQKNLMPKVGTGHKQCIFKSSFMESAILLLF